MADIVVKGIDQLKRDFARLNAAAQGRLARNAAMAMARVVANYARVNARSRFKTDTGQLVRSIKARRDPARQLRKGRVVAFANARAFYARFLEYGTVKMMARPFLRPALDEHLPEVQTKLIENLSRGILRETRKQQVPEDPGEF